jgi:nucleotide-binding universal stress UspA family protein
VVAGVDAKIIIGFDERAESLDALALGRQLAELTAAGVLVATVLPSETGAREGLDEEARRIFAPARSGLGGLSVETRACQGGAPARSLRSLAETEPASVVVVGSSSRAKTGHVLMGSVAEGLLRHSACAIAVAPRGLATGANRGIQAIGVAFDNSPESHAALGQAARLAGARGATLRVISVVEPHQDVDERRLVARRLQEVVDTLPKGLDVHLRLAVGLPVQQLAAETQSLDLMILGSRRYGLLRQTLVGYVSGGLLHGASCPVLVVPGPASPGEVSCGTSQRPRTAPALTGAKSAHADVEQISAS